MALCLWQTQNNAVDILSATASIKCRSLPNAQDEEKALETLMSKRTALQAKRAELERKIKDLGSLPSDAFEKYHDHTLQDLRKLLHKANTQLKKFR